MATKHISRSSKRASRPRKLTADEQPYYDLKAQPPQLTKSQSQNIDRTYLEDANGWARRMALATLTMGGGEIIERIETDREAAVLFAQTQLHIDDYVRRLDQLREILHAADMRLMVALCARDDMESVIAEAKAMVEASSRELS